MNSFDVETEGFVENQGGGTGSKILPKNYSEVKRIYFSGQSEAEKSIAGPFSKCFESDSDFEPFYYQNRKTQSEKIHLEFDEFPLFKESAKTRTNKLNNLSFC